MQGLVGEMAALTEYAEECRRQKEEDATRINQMAIQLDQKERLYVSIKEQVDSLAK